MMKMLAGVCVTDSVHCWDEELFIEYVFVYVCSYLVQESMFVCVQAFVCVLVCAGECVHVCVQVCVKVCVSVCLCVPEIVFV